MTMFFSKNGHSELDLEPRTLKVEVAIVIPNICVVTLISMN